MRIFFFETLARLIALGAWCPGEAALASYFPTATIVRLEDLELYYCSEPWTTALEGQAVLVLHLFDRSIRKQYEKREVLFADARMLPGFTLKTFQTVRSLGGNGSGLSPWFDALDWMCDRVREIEFDVALIGAGAYGLPLAAFVKSIGRKAVHLGGTRRNSCLGSGESGGMSGRFSRSFSMSIGPGRLRRKRLTVTWLSNLGVTGEAEDSSAACSGTA